MRYPWLTLWLGTAVVGSVVLLGCNHHRQQQCPSCEAGPVPHMVAAPSNYSPTVAYQMPAPPAPTALPPYSTLPPVQTAQAPAQSGPWNTPETTCSDIRQVSTFAPAEGVKEDLSKRRSYRDITAHPCFSHAEDYTWLCGQLDYVTVCQAWRLRYASVEEDDRYGGAVTLIETGPMDGFKSGQLVRVEGQLLNPENRDPKTLYRVRSIQPLSQP